MTFKSKAISYDVRANLFWFMVTVCAATVVIYFYALGTLAQETALRQSVEKQIAGKTLAVAELEFDYIALQNRITITDASRYGLREVRSSIYAARTVPGTLSYNVPTR